jgi:putative addiction module component (TIGR02574 family)
MKIYSRALSLNPTERLQLIVMLARSFIKSDDVIEKAWGKESEERYNTLSEDKVKTIPIEQIVRNYK